MKGRRIVWPSPGTVSVEEFTVRKAGSREILVETEFSVISPGTELAFLRGEANTSGVFPQYPGYSGVGRVLDIGEGVTAFRAGDQVIMDHCGHTSHAVCDVDGWRGQGITRIEDDAIPSCEAAFLTIASMSLQGVRKAKLELGESVMVMGQGLLGLFAVQLAKLSGAVPVVAVDLDQDRLRLAAELGADAAVSPETEPLSERIGRITGGRGVNAVIEVTGAGKALAQALSCCARCARVVLLGCTRGVTEGINYYETVHKTGVSIIGAHNFVRPGKDSSAGYWTTKDDLAVLLKLLSAKRLQISPMISSIHSPEKASDVYAGFMARKPGMPGAVFDWHK